MARKTLGSVIAAIAAVIVLVGAPAAAAFVPRESSSFYGVSAPNFYLMNQQGQDAFARFNVAPCFEKHFDSPLVAVFYRLEDGNRFGLLM